MKPSAATAHCTPSRTVLTPHDRTYSKYDCVDRRCAWPDLAPPWRFRDEPSCIGRAKRPAPGGRSGFGSAPLSPHPPGSGGVSSWLPRVPFKRGDRHVQNLATARIEHTSVEIEERLGPSSLEVTELHADSLETAGTSTVVSGLERPFPRPPRESARFGHFCAGRRQHRGGCGIVRQVRALPSPTAALTVHLARKFASEPDGNLVDHTRATRNREFEVTHHCLDTYARGDKVLHRLRDPGQIEPVVRRAHQHHLGSSSSRRGGGVDLLLHQEYPRPIPEIDREPAT